MSDISRRDFMKVAGWAATVTGFSAIAVPIIAYFFPANLEETPSEPVPIGPPEDFPEGASKIVPYGRYPALVISTTDGIKVYSSVCTHFACLVKWNAETGEIECPCHEGYFDPITGDVLRGPPPTALEAFPTFTGDDGQLYIGEKTT